MVQKQPWSDFAVGKIDSEVWKVSISGSFLLNQIHSRMPQGTALGTKLGSALHRVQNISIFLANGR